MKNRMGLLILIAALALSTLATAGCNRERPAPTPGSTVALPAQAGAPTPAAPAAAVTQVALPTQPSGAAGAQAGAQANGPATTPPTPRPIAPQASPPPPPPAPVPTASSSGPASQPTGETAFFIYKVALGDTVGELAEKFGVTPDDILNLNPMADPDVLMVGQELKIPGQAPREYGGASAYTVRTGDTLYSIALRFGVTLAELQDLNNIADENQIYVGQELKIPATAGATAPSEAKTYVVQAGDTLFSIALRFGVTTWALQVANDIPNENQIYVGQELKIP